MSSSVIPSARYSSFGSALRFCNGKIATLCLSSVGCFDENAGGTKLFDRTGSDDCKGLRYLLIATRPELCRLVGIEPFAKPTEAEVVIDDEEFKQTSKLDGGGGIRSHEA